MNIRKRMHAAMLMVIMLCMLCVGSVTAQAQENKKQAAQILFTHDIHSHLDTYKAEKDGETVQIGGLAKMKTVIDEKRSENPATVLLDGGDFSMGTLYQTIYETDASELVMLGRLGFDATTLGNHEFDYRSEGLSNMLHAAKEQEAQEEGLTLPRLLSANIDWDKNTSEENRTVRKALSDYGSTAYTILEKDGIRIGVYGVMGKDAEACAPESGLEFEDIVQTSKEVVGELKKQKADLIICISHSGTMEDAKKSEDELLAKAVPEIDVIVSGHTHTTLEQYLQVGNTYIVSAGCYASALGEVDLSRENGRWKLDNYQLNSLDETIPEDEEVLGQLENYKEKVNQEYLAQFGYSFDQVLAVNEVGFTQMDTFGTELKEDTLGSLIADAYVFAVQETQGTDAENLIAFAPSGTIRDTFQKGEITVADAFRVCSLGIGEDRIPGYPLVSAYLTGAELKTVAEIDVSVSPFMTVAQLYPSGLHWTFNPNRVILNRVVDTELCSDVTGARAGVQTNDSAETLKKEKIQDDKLYQVTVGLYSAQMLGAVEDTSFGLLKVTPKDAAGNKITDFEEYIIKDAQGRELKEWQALAVYLQSFETNADGIPEIPMRYEDTEGRKAEQDSKNPAQLFKKLNKYAGILAGAAFLTLAVLFGLGALLVRTGRKWYTLKCAKNQIHQKNIEE